MNLDLFCLDRYISNFFSNFSSQQFLVSAIFLWLLSICMSNKKREV